MSTATKRQSISTPRDIQNLITRKDLVPWQKPEIPARPPGQRRLRHLTRDEQRPLESRLYHLRRVHCKDDAEISSLLDLHPDDLDDLAATAGQP